MTKDETIFINKFVEEVWKNERRNINILEFENIMSVILIRRSFEKDENSSRNRRGNSKQRKRK